MNTCAGRSGSLQIETPAETIEKSCMAPRVEHSFMSNVPNRDTFEKAYTGSAGKAPWDVGQPQAPLIAVADRVTSPVLDIGCGTGDTALFFAARGDRVTGIDFVEAAIRRARVKAAKRNLAVEFLVKDALTLGDCDRQFASVIDSGLFHVFSGDNRRRYVQGLAQVLDPGGRLFLMCGSDAEQRNIIPRVSRQELYDAFAEGWEVESVQPVRYSLNPEYKFPEGTFSEAKGWFAIIGRKG